MWSVLRVWQELTARSCGHPLLVTPLGLNLILPPEKRERAWHAVGTRMAMKMN